MFEAEVFWAGGLALTVGVAVVVRFAAALPADRRPASWRRFAACEDGASVMLDFILVFPLFTMIVLVVVQLALMINARIVVGYAAYTAARSAIVWLDEGEDLALEKSHAAASISCLPISPASLPLLGGAGLFALPEVAPLLLHDGISGSMLRRLMRGGRKLVYSQQATDVTLSGTEDFGPRDPVTATVSYRFYLSVPYAATLFSTSIGGRFLGVPTIEIEDSVTLLNEGRIRTPFDEG